MDTDSGSPEVTSADVLKAAAAESGRSPDDGAPSRIEVTVRVPAGSAEDAVASEAKKGYDLLVIGVEQTRTKSGDFNPALTPIVAAFDGPLILVAGRDRHFQQLDVPPARILVPVAGTDVSRRAAEVAIALGRACSALVTVLYVSGRTSHGSKPARARQREQAILRDIVEIAEGYGTAVKTAVRAAPAPNEAILAEAKKGRHDLIVIGANRRPGDKLFFGDTAAFVFEQAPGSIILVIT
ncbi:universal stress protein [Bradyrhizobium sp. AZCC 2289]|uniref:universal stress protein n=1 Tax=Bradyrhizobium sp. AZCC 2289 TaxID=3117026 RepID=UPI002FF37960